MTVNALLPELDLFQYQCVFMTRFVSVCLHLLNQLFLTVPHQTYKLRKSHAVVQSVAHGWEWQHAAQLSRLQIY